jgi:hypothetical protein
VMRKLKILATYSFIMAFAASCSMVSIADEKPNFEDVSREPPQIDRAYLDNIMRNTDFAKWVLYQKQQCNKHGCLP